MGRDGYEEGRNNIKMLAPLQKSLPSLKRLLNQNTYPGPAGAPAELNFIPNPFIAKPISAEKCKSWLPSAPASSTFAQIAYHPPFLLPCLALRYDDTVVLRPSSAPHRNGTLTFLRAYYRIFRLIHESYCSAWNKIALVLFVLDRNSSRHVQTTFLPDYMFHNAISLYPSDFIIGI